jgi:DNA-binding NtrC family response regulator
MCSLAVTGVRPQRQQQPHNPKASPRRPHVLVVEPDWAIQQLCKDALECIGVAVSVVSHATEARAIVHSDVVNLAYVALVPGREREGEAFAEFAADRGMTVVLMSGHAEGIEVGLKARHSFLKKPFRLRDMFRPLILNIGASDLPAP